MNIEQSKKLSIIDFLDKENVMLKKKAYGSKWVFFSEKNTHSSSYRSFWVLNPL